MNNFNSSSSHKKCPSLIILSDFSNLFDHFLLSRTHNNLYQRWTLWICCRSNRQYYWALWCEDQSQSKYFQTIFLNYFFWKLEVFKISFSHLPYQWIKCFCWKHKLQCFLLIELFHSLNYFTQNLIQSYLSHIMDQNFLISFLPFYSLMIYYLKKVLKKVQILLWFF